MRGASAQERKALQCESLDLLGEMRQLSPGMTSVDCQLPGRVIKVGSISSSRYPELWERTMLVLSNPELFVCGGRMGSDDLHRKHREMLRTVIAGPLGQGPFWMQRCQNWRFWAGCGLGGRVLTRHTEGSGLDLQ